MKLKETGTVWGKKCHHKGLISGQKGTQLPSFHLNLTCWCYRTKSSRERSILSEPFINFTFFPLVHKLLRTFKECQMKDCMSSTLALSQDFYFNSIIEYQFSLSLSSSWWKPRGGVFPGAAGVEERILLIVFHTFVKLPENTVFVFECHLFSPVWGRRTVVL